MSTTPETPSVPAGSAPAPHLPRAVHRQAPTPRWAWLIPLAAAVLTLALAWQAWQQRGVLISVHLEAGHGLEPGDPVRYRGVNVGQVTGTNLSRDLAGVDVEITLQPPARDLARAGSRFWVVRPQLGLQGIAGLDTLVGPQYLAVLPGDGPPQHSFVGLENPPIVDSIEPGDLEFVVQTRQRAGIRAGAPVVYRQVRVGTVLSVGLTSDSGAVEVRVHVPQAYAPLIREQTRFWPAGGLEIELGLRGMQARLETLETLVAGGIAFATPPRGGNAVRNGHRFEMAARAEAEWLNWDPLVAIGSSYLPPGAQLPTPMRAVANWKLGNWLGGSRTLRGWVLRTGAGLLGPADLLTAPPEVESGAFVLEIGGQPIEVRSGPSWSEHGLARLDVRVGAAIWPASLQRHPESTEDCLVLADPSSPALPLAASRLRAEGSLWWIDPSVPLDEAWHGACVLARRDGKLVGLLLVTDARPRVALLP